MTPIAAPTRTWPVAARPAAIFFATVSGIETSDVANATTRDFTFTVGLPTSINPGAALRNAVLRFARVAESTAVKRTDVAARLRRRTTRFEIALSGRGAGAGDDSSIETMGTAGAGVAAISGAGRSS